MINASVGQGLDSDMKKRMGLDRRLLAALLDRWRPETHTFHLPCGETAPTLQDVSYLLGLPIAREAVGAVDILDTWRLELFVLLMSWYLPTMKLFTLYLTRSGQRRVGFYSTRFVYYIFVVT
jgi:hypothetical protein